MKVVSFNANGIRAAARKGFFDWLSRSCADVVCIQETKAQLEQLDKDVFCPKGYHCYYHDAEKKGYSGVCIYTKVKPKKVTTGLAFDHADREGRYIQCDFANISIVSLYLPSGTTGEIRQQVKYKFLDHYLKLLKKQIKATHPFIICGDWNIVHKEIDIKNFKANQKTSGCLPEERAWIDGVFTKVGWVDAFRVVNKKPEQYTWWSHRGQAYAKNVGWRIDYQVVSPSLEKKILKAAVYKEQRFSDHAPLIIDYDFELG